MANQSHVYKLTVARAAHHCGGTAALARALGVSPTAVGLWMTGMAPVPLDQFLKMAEFVVDHSLAQLRSGIADAASHTRLEGDPDDLTYHETRARSRAQRAKAAWDDSAEARRARRRRVAEQVREECARVKVHCQSVRAACSRRAEFSAHLSARVQELEKVLRG